MPLYGRLIYDDPGFYPEKKMESTNLPLIKKRLNFLLDIGSCSNYYEDLNVYSI
jgi:hypothetical protein